MDKFGISIVSGEELTSLFEMWSSGTDCIGPERRLEQSTMSLWLMDVVAKFGSISKWKLDMGRIVSATRSNRRARSLGDANVSKTSRMETRRNKVSTKNLGREKASSSYLPPKSSQARFAAGAHEPKRSSFLSASLVRLTPIVAGQSDVGLFARVHSHHVVCT